MREVWFEDEMVLSDQVLEEESKVLSMQKNISKGQAKDEIKTEIKSVVHVFKPYCKLISPNELNPIVSTKNLNFLIMKLEFELEADKNFKFVEASYHTEFYPADNNKKTPVVYDLFPKDYYEEEEKGKIIHLAFKPEITILDFGGSLGEISGDIRFGKIEPAITGYYGEEKQKPHWRFEPHSRILDGIRTMWLVLSMPKEISEFKMSSYVQADLKTELNLHSLKSKSKLIGKNKLYTVKLQ